ncbi:MAG: hypothetical protein ABJA37_14985 [Ferruginibacter sp.]
MKEYQFQYTIQRDLLLLILACFVSILISIFIGMALFPESKQMPLTLTVISIIVPFIIFRYFKNKVVNICIAKLNKTSVEFELKDSIIKLVNFNDLISYKVYYSTKGPILYLKLNSGRFKIFAHNYYCNSDPFNDFCKDLEIKIENYKAENKVDIIREGSIFVTKGMLYFLIVTTSIYFISFFIETNSLRIAIEIGGGIYLFIFWIKYFIEKNKKIDKPSFIAKKLL